MGETHSQVQALTDDAMVLLRKRPCCTSQIEVSKKEARTYLTPPV